MPSRPHRAERPGDGVRQQPHGRTSSNGGSRASVRGQPAHQRERDEERRQPARPDATAATAGGRPAPRRRSRPAPRTAAASRACRRSPPPGPPAGRARCRRRSRRTSTRTPAAISTSQLTSSSQPMTPPAPRSTSSQPTTNVASSPGWKIIGLDDIAGVPAAGVLEDDVDREGDEIQERGRGREHPPRPHGADDPRGDQGDNRATTQPGACSLPPDRQREVLDLERRGLPVGGDHLEPEADLSERRV